MSSQKKPSSAALLVVEPSHGRPRLFQRRGSDGGTPTLPAPEPEDAAPMQDTKTGRFLPGNRAHRRRQRAQLVRGVATLDPARCESWLAPHVREGATYAVQLLGRFTDPALARLVGATADSHAIYRSLVALGAKGDAKALTEARAWLREHRACLRELAFLGATTRDAHAPKTVEDMRREILGPKGTSK